MDELHYLREFYQWADFGPAHDDVLGIFDDWYRDEYGALPEGYEEDEDDGFE